MRWRLTEIVFGVFLLGGVIIASESGDYLTSEEEILDALAGEEVAYTQYYDLLELFREKVSVFGDEIDRLLVIPGVDERWIRAVEEAAEKAGAYGDEETFVLWFPYDYNRIAAFVEFEKRKAGVVGGGTKVYSHCKFIEGAEPTTNVSISGRYRRTRLDFRFFENNNEVGVRRRSIEGGVLKGKYRIGSFYSGLGEGLVLGKAFHIPGASRKNTGLESLSSPQDNLFNGGWFYRGVKRLGFGILASRVVYNSVSVDALGAELSWSLSESLQIGGVLAYGGVAARPFDGIFQQNSGSLFIRSRLPNVESSAEIGCVEGESFGGMAEAIVKFVGTRALIAFWTYDDDFNPIHSNGKSDYKETKIELGESGIVQGSRQAGETGVEVKLTTPLRERLFFNFSQSGWETPAIKDWGLVSEAGLSYRGSEGRRASCFYSMENRTLTSGVRRAQTVRLSSDLPLDEDIFTQLYFRVRGTSMEEDTTLDGSLSTHIEVGWRRFKPLELRLRLKRAKSSLSKGGNGYWELRFRDEVKSGPVSLCAEIRFADYDKKDKDSLVEFRITLSYLWR